jgi:hypothetical protein
MGYEQYNYFGEANNNICRGGRIGRRENHLLAAGEEGVDAKDLCGDRSMLSQQWASEAPS